MPIVGADAQWKKWFAAMRSIAALVGRGDLSVALSEVDSVLAAAQNPEIRSDALGFRARIREDLGDLNAAKDDLRSARLLVGPGYARYVHELSLGQLCRKTQRLSESQEWYRVALQTAIDAEHLSCGAALQEFLALQSNRILSSDDFELCRQAIKRSWQILELLGRPETADLPLAASIISSAEAAAHK